MNIRSLTLSVILCFSLPLHASQIPPQKDVSCRYALKGSSWVENSVIYSIFPRNFSKSGDFKSVTKHLKEIKNLGVNVIWLLPIHPIGNLKKKGSLGSPYSVQNYDKINPDYGTAKDLKELVKTAHQLDLKVIIDAVLNHTSWDNTLIKEHPEFYKHNQYAEIISPLPEWSDVAALDYTNPELQSYIINLLKYWLQEFDLDGFRFDASDFVPLDFWKKMRNELLKINKDILLLGEGEDPEALCEAFDLDYDWHLKKAIDDVIINGRPVTATIKELFKKEEQQFPKGSLHLRFTDNHDERRAIARYSEKGSLAASFFIFTLNGVPLIYNGMEVGDSTESRDPALFEKMDIFWNSSFIRPEFRSFYEKIIALRKQLSSLSKGKLTWIKNSSEERILTYLKSTPEETILIAVNFSNQPFNGSIELEGTFEDLTPRIGPSRAHSLPLPQIELGAWDYLIYKLKN